MERSIIITLALSTGVLLAIATSPDPIALAHAEQPMVPALTVQPAPPLLTAPTAPTGTTPPAPAIVAGDQPQILRIIDADGRDHFVLGATIIRVERATYPERSTWVTMSGSGWNPVLTITGEPKDVAAAWAACAGLRVAPVAVGVPPSAPTPIRAVNP